MGEKTIQVNPNSRMNVRELNLQHQVACARRVNASWGEERLRVERWNDCSDWSSRTEIISLLFDTNLMVLRVTVSSDGQKLTRKLLTNSLTTFLKLDHYSLTNRKKIKLREQFNW